MADFIQNLEVSTGFYEESIIRNFMILRAVGITEIRSDRQTEKTGLTVAFSVKKGLVFIRPTDQVAK